MDPVMMLRQLALEVRAAEGTDSRRLVFRGTTETVASDGGILRAEGMDTARFDKNPVVLWGHGHTLEDIPVIGRVVDRKLDKKDRAWDFTIEFPNEGTHDLADRVYRMAKAGFIRAASVGFNILEVDRDLTEKEREDLGLSPWGFVATRWELHELSLVSIGADPNALQRSIDAGAIKKGDERILARTPEAPDMRGVIEALNGLAGAINLLRGDLAEQRDATAALTDQMDGFRTELREADETDNRPEPARGEEPATARGKPEGESDEDLVAMCDRLLTALGQRKEAQA